jgi:importin subunit beta-1
VSPQDLSADLKGQVVSAFVKNFQAGEQFQKSTNLAVKGFLNALSFAHSNFQNEIDRNFIMQRIFEVCTYPDESTRITGMQIVVEMARQEYENIQHYFVKFCDLTANAAKNDVESIGALALEFWTSLAEEEHQRIKKSYFVRNYIH